ncbi:hypothetical protein FDA94_26695 [Herbidospora galbida]|uniref:Uncharacterized protein n=1 Tax=Herbidospora galbida TaxID=2575442 RepID=A0A4U3MAD2_9ACTN|nr:hypothetical protein [Herbidospora galbida]TKK85259.1 hypothetical protein FDA94_26695 [Herbidospora galbida]
MPLLDSGEDLIGLDEGMFYIQDVDGFDGSDFPSERAWLNVMDDCITVSASDMALTASVRLEC